MTIEISNFINKLTNSMLLLIYNNRQITYQTNTAISPSNRFGRKLLVLVNLERKYLLRN